MPAIHPRSESRFRATFVWACAVALGPAANAAAAAEFATFADATPALSADAVTLDGAPFNLGPAADRPTIVHFFATWCLPCRDELPELARFEAAHEGRFATVGVDVAEPAARVGAFLAPFALGFPVALDPERRAARRFGVRTLPSTVVLGAGGVRALAAFGPVDWTAAATLAAIESVSAASAVDAKPAESTP